MTRKHYVEVARILRDAQEAQEVNEYAAERMAERFAAMFAADNPRFDRDRFMAATDPRECAA